MDVGAFSRSRVRLANWLAVPVVVMCAVYIAGHLVQRHASLRLADRISTKLAFDHLDRSLAQYRKVSAAFRPAKANDEAWNSDLYDVATDHTVNILSVMRRTVKSAADREVDPDVVIRAEGSILALTQFLHELERPERLLTIKTASLDCTMAREEPRYQAEFVFQQHRAAPAGAAANPGKPAS